MTPVVTGVTEQTALGGNGKITKVLVVKYIVGTDGPFTLTTNQQDLASGVAQQQMLAFANTLANLPRATGS